MRVPITTLIAENILSTCSAIDITDIYPEAAITAELDGDITQPKNWKICIFELSPDIVDSDVNLDERKSSFNIIGFIMPETTTIKPITYMRTFEAAIEVELNKDITRGGYAANTLVKDINYIDDSGIFAVQIEIEVHYAHPVGNPFVEIPDEPETPIEE